MAICHRRLSMVNRYLQKLHKKAIVLPRDYTTVATVATVTLKVFATKSNGVHRW